MVNYLYEQHGSENKAIERDKERGKYFYKEID